MDNITTRVQATKDKIALLQQMQSMINQLRKQAAAIEDKIEVMIKSDLDSMEAEKNALEDMKTKILNHKGDGVKKK